MLRSQRDKNAKEATRLQVEGAVEKLMRLTLYLKSDCKLTSASMQDFIRVNRDGLKALDPALFARPRSGKAGLVSYLNDIIEGSLEPESGWIKKVLAIENTPLLAIENSTN